MLNPFVFGAYPKLEQEHRVARDVYREQDQAQPGRPATALHQLTVGLGKVLIEVGSKLVEEEPAQCKQETLAA